MRAQTAALLLIVIAASSCSQLMGRLRRDLNDMPEQAAAEAPSGPTYGGRWAERGTLMNEDGSMSPGYYAGRNEYPNHSERAPASVVSAEGTPAGSWLDGDAQETSRRDQYRELPMASQVATVQPAQKRAYKNGDRATKADFMDEDQKSGSLWASDGQTNYFFTKNKVRGPGDIVTLTLEAPIASDLVQEAKRALSPAEMAKELATIQEGINSKYLPLIQKAEAELEAKKLAEKQKKETGNTDTVVASAAAPVANPGDQAATPTPEGSPTREIASEKSLLANELGAILPAGAPTARLIVGDKEYIVPKADPSAVDLASALEIKGGDTAMTEIVERFPNGNYKIRGIKKVNYKNGAPRYMQITGIVKAADISEEDTTVSGKLYEYRIESLR